MITHLITQLIQTIKYPETWTQTTLTLNQLETYDKIIYTITTIGTMIYITLSLPELDPNRRTIGLETLYTNIAVPILILATLGGLVANQPVKTLAIYSIPATITYTLIMYMIVELSYTLDGLVALDRPIGAPVASLHRKFELTLLAFTVAGITYALYLYNPTIAISFILLLVTGYLGIKVSEEIEEKLHKLYHNEKHI